MVQSVTVTIDLQTHLGPTRMDKEKVHRENLEENVDALLAQMNAFGIEKAVLTPLEPWISTDLYVEAAAIYPDQLFSACAVVPRPIDMAWKKVAKHIDQGCVALVLDERTYHPSDPAAIALVQEAVGCDLPVFFHNHEMTVEMMTLIDQVSLTYPNGKFVVLHMGGLFGFHNLVPLIARENIWLEISVTLIKLVESPLRVFLDAILQDLGSERLVFGSNHFTDYSDLMAALNMMDLNVETSQAIRELNAMKILGL